MINKCEVIDGNDYGIPAMSLRGTFPSTFEGQDYTEFAQSWQPTMHINCESATFDVALLHDGLPKISGLAGSENVVGTV